MKLVYKQVPSEKGEVFNNYYLQLDNGMLIAIRPSFNDDYRKLRVIASKLEDK